MTSLKKQFISGVVYTAAAKYAGLIIQLVITGVLSRLLTPDDFGIVAIATVFITFFNLLSDFGIGPAIIQTKDLEEEEIRDIFTFSIYVGLGLGVFFFIAGTWIADIYNKPVLVTICRLLSINVFFASINIVPNAMLLREKKFKFIALRTLFIQVVCGVIGIAAALSGMNLYSLIIYSISSAIALFAVNYYQNPLFRHITFKSSSLKKIYHYSIYQFFFNFINYFSRNLDTLFIGRFLSTAVLGYYDKAYRLMLLPVENLTHVLSPVIHPLFSDFQHDKKKIEEGYGKIVFFLAMLGFPASAYLPFVSRELIYIIFGNQWENAVPVFQILSWSVGIQIVLSSSGSIFQAANGTKMLFLSGFLSAIAMVGGICYGVFVTKTSEGVAYGLIVAFVLNFIQAYLLLIRFVLHGSLSRFLRAFIKPLLLFFLVLIFEYVFYRMAFSAPVFLSFILKTFIAGCAVVTGIIITGDYKLVIAIVKGFLQSRK
ncbi:polysaccharide transporter, PST family [Chitinophaga sp. YR627]|uniref:lipopolysaccharide biosynthesis protein n=1 Tax=Chitinophaga sp. YR627 TaxID=1881041 RepID=UPI0008F1A011|nr:lipopolysaccharide biosynthesis protein [Chitinophaga sp. YR627]SFN91891.1 polysaccharide transporter, PST family [Chitinophaga sp. YR627]